MARETTEKKEMGIIELSAREKKIQTREMTQRKASQRQERNVETKGEEEDTSLS